MYDDSFRAFLLKAKANTYAAQRGFAPSARPGCTELRYAEGSYEYVDSYAGERDFSGQELVYVNGKPAWSMNYYGAMLADGLPEGFIETLREALLQVRPEEPYRGCPMYERGPYSYRCSSSGALTMYSGIEEISLGGKPVYRLFFHGGAVR